MWSMILKEDTSHPILTYLMAFTLCLLDCVVLFGFWSSFLFLHSKSLEIYDEQSDSSFVLFDSKYKYIFHYAQ